MNGSDVRIMMVALGEERPLGTFTANGNGFRGRGNCGTLYEGSYAPASDGGLDVTMTASIPRGTRIGSSPAATEDRTFAMNLHLTAAEASGTATKKVLLPGFGRARLRIFISAAGEPQA